MKLYLTYAQLPELKKFSKAHRQMIFSECIEPMLDSRRWPVVKFLLCWVVFVVLSAVLGGIAPWGMFGALLGGMVVDHLWDLNFMARQRTELQRRVESLVWTKMASTEVFTTH